ncbi:hypothetical protein GSI_01159 [Ganoderma sinense ZZ0214-1]|uniref:Uncharacterized protein n=1 Tax=Ganoderma sinense ZZ0214-1 TaxID=1077348 RepID=A0A2G8SUL5_9APHY|nr:hypothetical protein GSI_01159 [Ganoderma sinense ZZ0214-1]
MVGDASPYDLATVPTELWRDIIELACTDGGATGRSLILTSKFFHTLANDSRLTSVALFSLDHVQCFLAFVRLRPSEWRNPVRHLYLSFLHEPVISANDESCEKWQSRFTRTMNNFMVLVAPYLRTLTLLQSDRKQLPSFRLDCPMLTELAVWGDISAVVVHSCSGASGPHLPALRRFHFISNEYKARTCLLAPSSWLSTTRLTHLRLSDIDNADEREGFTDTLAGAIGVHMPGSGGSDAVSPQGKGILLPHLRCLWIHGSEWYIASCLEEDWDDGWQLLMPKLREVMKEAERERGMRTLIMERSWRKGRIWALRLWDDWLERMEGLHGCWVESEDEERALEGPDTVKPHEGGQIWD